MPGLVSGSFLSLGGARLDTRLAGILDPMAGMNFCQAGPCLVQQARDDNWVASLPGWVGVTIAYKCGVPWVGVGLVVVSGLYDSVVSKTSLSKFK